MSRPLPCGVNVGSERIAARGNGASGSLYKEGCLSSKTA